MSFVHPTVSITAFALLVSCAQTGIGYAQHKVLVIADEAVNSIALSPNRNVIAVDYLKEGQRFVLLFDLKKQKRLDVFSDDSPSPAGDMAFSRDGNTLMSWLRETVADESVATVTFLNLGSRKLEKTLQVKGEGFFLSEHFLFTRQLPDRKVAVVTNVENGKQITLKGHNSQIVRGAASADGTYLATAERNGLVKIWEFPSGKEKFTVESKDQINQLIFLKTELAVVRNFTRFFDLRTGKLSERIVQLPAQAISADEKLMVYQGKVLAIDEKNFDILPDGIHIFSRKHKKVLVTFKLDPRIQQFFFTSEDRYLLGRAGREFHLWEISNLKP
jgi:WD40 repeat protein